MKLDYYTIGKQIRICRKRKGISQEQLSEIINISASFLSCLENGYRSMSLETVVSIANALNVTVDMLLAENLSDTDSGSCEEFTLLLSDCSDYERRVLLDTAYALKSALRQNHYLSQKKR